MPLDPSALASALQTLFESMPSSKEAAALGIANAYRDYVSTALFGSSVPVIIDDMRDAMASTLVASFGAAPAVANAFGAALTTFWAAVPVVGAQVGVTAGCPGASSVPGTLVPVFTNLANTHATFAAGIASALHTATMTVTANVSPPPGTTLPIA